MPGFDLTVKIHVHADTQQDAVEQGMAMQAPDGTVPFDVAAEPSDDVGRVPASSHATGQPGSGPRPSREETKVKNKAKGVEAKRIRYGMYSKQGDAVVHQGVVELIDKVNATIRDGIRRIGVKAEGAGFGEATDTAVRETIYYTVLMSLRADDVGQEAAAVLRGVRNLIDRADIRGA